MHTKEYNFRYSDRDVLGNIKPCTVLDLLQDISISHTDYVGLNAKKMQEISLACLLEGWRIQFNESLCSEKAVTVKTGIMEFKRCESIRKYEIWQDGKCKIIATAVWFTVDTDSMKIIRIPEVLSSAYENINEEDNGLKCTKLRPSGDAEFLCENVVQKRDLDTNNHVNNMKSVEMILSYLPDDFDIFELKIRYCKELKKDEHIKFYTETYENQFYCELKNEADEVCVILLADKKS